MSNELIILNRAAPTNQFIKSEDSGGGVCQLISWDKLEKLLLATGELEPNESVKQVKVYEYGVQITIDHNRKESKSAIAKRVAADKGLEVNEVSSSDDECGFGLGPK